MLHANNAKTILFQTMYHNYVIDVILHALYVHSLNLNAIYPVLQELTNLIGFNRLKIQLFAFLVKISFLYKIQNLYLVNNAPLVNTQNNI